MSKIRTTLFRLAAVLLALPLAAIWPIWPAKPACPCAT